MPNYAKKMTTYKKSMN